MNPERPLRRRGRGAVANPGSRFDQLRYLPDPEVEDAEALPTEVHLEVARSLGTPPYVVASDRTLRELVRLRPENQQDLLLVHGIGPAKAKRFGKSFLKVVREAG